MSNNKQAADEGWIEWHGGECPVDDESLIHVKFKDCDASNDTPEQAGLFRWGHIGSCADIIAYRLHKPEHSEPEYHDGIKPTDPAKQAPTIEQLAADYRAKLAIYEQAKEELDSHRCGAEAAFARLELAGKALGLVIGIAGYDQAEPEPINITDWRDLRVGDVVEVIGSDNDGWKRLAGLELDVVQIGNHCDDVKFKPRLDSTWTMSDNTEWRFIRRP